MSILDCGAGEELAPGPASKRSMILDMLPSCGAGDVEVGAGEELPPRMSERRSAFDAAGAPLAGLLAGPSMMLMRSCSVGLITLDFRLAALAFFVGAGPSILVRPDSPGCAREDASPPDQGGVERTRASANEESQGRQPEVQGYQAD